MDSDKIQILGLFCPLCGGDTELIWKDNLIARRCKKCGVIFCPSSKETTSIYDESYFERWYIKSRFKRKRYIRKLIEKIGKAWPLQPGNLLDIGCGVGIFLEIMKENGWKISGTEVSPYACRYCEKKEFDVVCCQLEEAGFLSSYFDLITAFDVIAHLYKPQNYLREIYRILKKDGLLIIKTPHHPAFLFRFANIFRFTRKSKSLLHIPAQIFHFAPCSIKKFLSMNGFDILSTIRVNDIPAFFISFSLKSMFIFLEQLFLRIISGSDSLIVIARKKFPIKEEIKV
ncbi:MAG: class I SAM-dependent methyltransferase [Candidatus Omnitrophica bacterium]|nr:class I SAM-dependent methyltransferase [Candidatus Omnitrophota bacterium]